MNKYIWGFIGISCFLFHGLVFGQVQFNNYPDNKKNTRFGSSDRFNIVRPSLSIRSFDSDGFADQGDYRRGLKQILELIYGTNPNSELQAYS